MKRRWAWFVALPLAVAALTVFAANTLLGHDATTSEEALEARMAAEQQATEGQAFAALGLQDGDCMNSSDPLFRDVGAATLDKEAGTKGGWVMSRFVGTLDELAASKNAVVVARGKTTGWTLSVSDTEKSIREYTLIELPSGRTAWLPGALIATAPCLN